jgi:outer membrane protein assembly factor BamD (BamD/ComL family)
MLRPTKKIHRKEIKEDALVTHYFRVRKLYDRFSREVNIGLMVLLAVVVIGFLMARSKRGAEIRSQEMLGLAEQAYYMNDYPRVIRDMAPILKNYPGTRAAGTAAFYTANANYSQNNIAEAEKYFVMVADHYGKNPLFSASSLAGLAAIEESRKQTAKAAKLYEKAGKKFPGLYAAPFYLKEAARCYLASEDKTSAAKLLDFIQKKYPESAVSEEVQWLKESI